MSTSNELENQTMSKRKAKEDMSSPLFFGPSTADDDAFVGARVGGGGNVGLGSCGSAT